MITGAQIRAARVILDWSIIDLASRSGVGRKTIENFERDNANRPDEQFVAQIKAALERGGIEFAEGQPPRFTTGPVKRATWDPPPER